MITRFRRISNHFRLFKGCLGVAESSESLFNSMRDSVYYFTVENISGALLILQTICLKVSAILPGRLENLITVSGQIIFDFQRTKIFCLFYQRIVSVIQVALWQSNCLAGVPNIISNRSKPQVSNLASPSPLL